MGLSLSTGSAILKTFYLPPLQRLFNKQTILWDRVERESNWNPEGKNFTLALHYGRHAQAGSGRASSSAVLPRKATQKYANAVVPSAYLYTTIEVEGPVIEHARSNAGSFVRAVRSEVEGAAESHRKSMNRQANGDGRDWLGFYRSGTGTGSGTLDDGGVNSGTAHAFSYFQPGVPTTVDLIDASDDSTILDNSVEVTVGAENATSLDFEYTSGNIDASASAGNDYFVLEDTLGYQMTGLQAIIDNVDPVLLPDGLHDLSVDDAPWWASQVIGSTSSPQDLRFPLLNRILSRVAKNSPNGKDDVEFILTSYAGQDTYYELAANERIAVNTMVLDGGYEGVEFNGIPIVADPEHWIGSYSFIVPSALRILQVKDTDWMDRDGNVLSRVSGADAYEATMFAYMNLGTPARNSLGKLRGINMSA